MRTPCSASIDDSSVSATTTPESCTDFLATGRTYPKPGAAIGLESGAVAHQVTLIPGDGTGPELTEATRRVLEATGVDFEWDVQQAGADVMESYGGNPLPEHVLHSIKRTGGALKGPITTPVGGGFRSVNVTLRKTLDLFGQVRPCKSYAGVRSRY